MRNLLCLLANVSIIVAVSLTIDNSAKTQFDTRNMRSIHTENNDLNHGIKIIDDYVKRGWGKRDTHQIDASPLSSEERVHKITKKIYLLATENCKVNHTKSINFDCINLCSDLKRIYKWKNIKLNKRRPGWG